MKDKVEQFKTVAELIAMAYETGAIRDPLTEFDLDLAISPLHNGAIAEQSQHRLFNKLAPRVMEMRLQGPPPPTFPYPSVNRRVVVGNVIATGERLPLGYAALNRHTLIVGPTGCGKSTLEAIIIKDLLEAGAMTIEYHDSKSEARRLLNHFPDDVFICRPDQEPVNHIAPTGPVERFCWSWMAEFAKASTLHPTTWPEAAEILVRIQRGLKSGDPPPSLIDYRNIFRKLAEKGSPKFFSVAGAFGELCSILGRTAFIRRGPRLDGLARVIVHERVGIPQKFLSFFAALRFMRLQAEAAREGREGDWLHRVVIEDEGQDAFGKELSQLAGSGYIAPAKRFLTKGRSTGTGIVASIQSLFGTDESLMCNTATTIVFGCPDYGLAVKAAELLGDRQLAPDVQNLPDRVVYVRSTGFSGPVKIRLLEFDLGHYPNDAEVQRRLAGKLAALAAQTEYAPDRPEEQPTLDYLHLLGERAPDSPVSPAIAAAAVRAHFLADHQMFLREIDRNPAAAVTQHYQNLKWSAGRGNRLKNQLLEMALIRVERQSSTAGRPVEILLLTDTGKELLNESAH